MNNFEQIRERINLKSYLQDYVEFVDGSQGPCPFCGGKDRFYVCSDGVHWACRKCMPSGGSVIDFEAKRRGVSIGAAARILEEQIGLAPSSGPSSKVAVRPSTTSDKPTQPKGTIEWQSLMWQEEAARMLDSAVSALNAGAGGEGRQYLDERRIQESTWRAFKLGFQSKVVAGRQRSSIVIPCICADGRTCGLKLRSLGKDAEQRYTMTRGSTSLLFGAHLLITGKSSNIIACEGEFNAMSIWQSSQRGDYHVVSFGSQSSNRGIELLKEHLSSTEYENVLVWTDAPEAGIAVASKLTRAMVMCSPKGLDANDVLVRYGADDLLKIIEFNLAKEPDFR